VSRDRASLGILFVMPLTFVIVMSLALQDTLGQRRGAAGSSARAGLTLAVLDGDRGVLAAAVLDGLSQVAFVKVELQPDDGFEVAADRVRADVRAGRRRFALVIPPGASVRLQSVLARRDPAELFAAAAEDRIALELLADPAIRPDQGLLVRTAVEQVLQGVEIRFAASLPGPPGGVAGGPGAAADAGAAVAGPDATAAGPGGGTGGLLTLTRAAGRGGSAGAAVAAPSSTQQNVPAYSLLAIFMLVVPLSQAFIKERAQGSLMRLRSMAVPAAVIVGGKLPPYLLINLLQMGLCLAVGRFVLPLLGGQALETNWSWPGVVLLTCAASLAAIGFGLMVSMFARTAEQASAFGGTAVLTLAALGGIMVPRSVMPASMQTLAMCSPLGWAQDGFLDLFVHGAGAVEVLDRAAALLGFAGVCMALAFWRFSTAPLER